MGWWSRVKDYQRLPKEQQCQGTGSVLVVWNRQRVPPQHVVDIDTELEKRMQAAIDAGAVTAEQPYPPYCMYGTQWYTAFKAMNANCEHARLCREHAREEHWLW